LNRCGIISPAISFVCVRQTSNRYLDQNQPPPIIATYERMNPPQHDDDDEVGDTVKSVASAVDQLSQARQMMQYAQGMVLSSEVLESYLQVRRARDHVNANIAAAAITPTPHAFSLQQQLLLNAQQQQQQPRLSAHVVDPWELYGGTNIAAACAAANEEGEGRDKFQGDSNEGDQKRRVAAWQKRERKRIELEELQERKEELIRRNEELQIENMHMRTLIERAKTQHQARVHPSYPLLHQRVNQPNIEAQPVSLLPDVLALDNTNRLMMQRRLQQDALSLVMASRQELLARHLQGRSQSNPMLPPQLQAHSRLLSPPSISQIPTTFSSSAQFLQQRPDLLAFAGRDLPYESFSNTTSPFPEDSKESRRSKTDGSDSPLPPKKRPKKL
jgi:hypothetical protein